MEDHEILQKFQHPDSRNLAFNQLVRKYQQKVYWHIRKMVIDHDEADDLRVCLNFDKGEISRNIKSKKAVVE